AGLLVHDAPERAHALLTQHGDPNLQVLCACSPGQTSLASEELGHTVFAHFLLLGLSGKADGVVAGKKADGKVSLRELVAYVTAEVDRWAWTVRGQRQTPAFYGPDTDYTIVFVPRSPPAAATPRDKTYPQELRSAWERRDGLRADPRARPAPEALRRLDAALLRADLRWRGGGDRLAADLKAAADVKVEPPAADDAPPRSLAEGVPRGRTPPEPGTTPRQLRDLAKLHLDAKKPMASAEDKAALKNDRKRLVDAFKGRSFDLAWLIFTTAAGRDVADPEVLRF